MKKRIQIFIASTYEDLRAERLAAIQDILTLGHIPAGMEMFGATGEEQFKAAKRWIDESEILLLILGSRYGTKHPTLHLSYTELEYQYALGTPPHRPRPPLPVCPLVLTDEALTSRLVLGHDDTSELLRFRKSLQDNKLCGLFGDIHEFSRHLVVGIRRLEQDHEFSGWVSGKEAEEREKDLRQKALDDEEKGYWKGYLRAYIRPPRDAG